MALQTPRQETTLLMAQIFAILCRKRGWISIYDVAATEPIAADDGDVGVVACWSMDGNC